MCGYWCDHGAPAALATGDLTSAKETLSTGVCASASKSSIRRFVITEKAPTRAL